MVSIILDYLSANESTEEILRQSSGLKPEDIQAAISYAAWLAKQEDNYPLYTEATGWDSN